MKEDIEKFRKLATKMLAGEILTKNDILKTMDISLPTLEKLINDPLDTIKVRASVLASVQDFNKTYRHYKDSIDELAEGAEKKRGRPAKVTDKELDDVVQSAKEMLEDSPPSCADKTIWSMLRELEKALPKNMSIQIIINSRK